LRVLDEYGYTIRLHDDCVDQLKQKHFNGYGFKNLNIKPFKNTEFTVGEFKIKPFEVIHSPWYPTYGYQIFYEDKKIVIVTDFCKRDNVLEHFVDADFIFVESNHDLELLRRNYNPNSRFHMPNPGTAGLLFEVVSESRKEPQTVMLGHISSQRNERDLALAETVAVFADADKEIGFQLLTAPLRECSEVVEVG
jgi:ribonuclease BN (tRNA processing enzyme)